MQKVLTACYAIICYCVNICLFVVAQSSTSTEITNEGEYLNFRMNHNADPDIVEKETEESKSSML